jgi:hypothetical protein
MAQRTFLIIVALVAGAMSWPAHTAAQRRQAQTAPETFTSPMQAKTDLAASAATLQMQIDRYTSEVNRKAITEALSGGGYPAFVQALRKAPPVGHLAIGEQKFVVRFAREQPTPKGREISLVTETPVYFLGGGAANAKPRAGFEVAIVRLSVDEFGLGSGTMAAAAKVKPDGQGGVVVEDYAEEPIKLTFVHREIK